MYYQLGNHRVAFCTEILLKFTCDMGPCFFLPFICLLSMKLICIYDTCTLYWVKANIFVPSVWLLLSLFGKFYFEFWNWNLETLTQSSFLHLAFHLLFPGVDEEVYLLLSLLPLCWNITQSPEQVYAVTLTSSWWLILKSRTKCAGQAISHNVLPRTLLHVLQNFIILASLASIGC